MSKTTLQRLVDELLDRARAEHPRTEFVIVLSKANSLLLPKDADRLERSRDGAAGFYRGHVYRDTLVEASADGPSLDTSAWLSPVQARGAPDSPTYRADLMTGQITTTGPGKS